VNTVRLVVISWRYDTAERTDAELLVAHVGGDRYAFAELVGRHHRQLYRFARRHCGSPEDAADVLQEALLAAHRNAAGFRQHATVASWLHRIVLNGCLDRLRRHKRHSTTALNAEVHTIGDRTAQVETAIVVQRALCRLTDDQRAAVVAVDMQGYSVADAAALLGVAEGTVKSRCARGRARLALELRPLRCA
jgi:RNA polymerase sigma-70 factor, ECF subfamily